MRESSGRGIGSVSNNRNNKNLSVTFSYIKNMSLLDRNWLHETLVLLTLFSSKYPQVPSDVATDLQVWWSSQKKMISGERKKKKKDLPSNDFTKSKDSSLP